MKTYLPIVALVIHANYALQAQIPPGYEMLDIFRAYTDWIVSPHMNECGQIVYAPEYPHSLEAEVYYYDNGLTVQLTRNQLSDTYPDINNPGTMTWTRGYDGRSAGEIMILQNGRLKLVAPGQSPRINDAGNCVWQRAWDGRCFVESHVYFYNGRRIRQISDGDLSNQHGNLNEADEFPWTRYDFCNEPWTSEILLYSNGNVSLLPTRYPQSQVPRLNNVGQVAWSAVDKMELWENGDARLLTDWGRNPQLNDHGDIYFLRWYDDSRTWQGWLRTKSEEFLQLTDDPFWNTDGDINNDMEICWRASDLNTGEWRVRYMRRIRTGEADFDGDVDLTDFAALAGCLTGPKWVEREDPGPQDSLCRCRFLDINHDGSVDLADVARFQNAYTGP